MTRSEQLWGRDRLEVGARVRYGALPTLRGTGEVVETRTRLPGTGERTDLRYCVTWPDGWTYWYRRIQLARVGAPPARAERQSSGTQWPQEG